MVRRVSVEVLSDELVCRGRRVSLLKRFVRVGINEFTRDVIDFGEAVAVVPILNNEKVVLLRQYRAAVKDWVYEIPAGRVEKGEYPDETARRELIEETGYDPLKLEYLISVYTAPGYSNEVLHIYVAEGLRYVGSNPEPGEVIEVVKVPMREVLNVVMNRKVADAKTVLALTLLALKRKYLINTSY